MLSPSNGYRLVVILYLKGWNQKLTSTELPDGAADYKKKKKKKVCTVTLKCHEFWGRLNLISENLLDYSQCYSSRPNVHFKPWKGVQSIGNLWGLEGRRALTGATCVIFCKWMKGLKKYQDNKMTRNRTCDAVPLKKITINTKNSELTSATPRSEILSAPSVVSSRFPGLMSLWTIPWLCKYSRPSISWQKYLRKGMGRQD